MSTLGEIFTGRPPAAVVALRGQLAEARHDLEVSELDRAALSDMAELHAESLGAFALQLEDRGWRKVGTDADGQLTADNRRTIRDLLRVVAHSHPLAKRALNLRTAGVWGSGVSIMVRDRRLFDSAGRRRTPGTQDVDAVVQDFLTDNEGTWLGARDRRESEWAMGTDGEVLWALFTDPMSGKVTPRRLLPEEIEHTIHDPEDRDAPRFYLRSYTTTDETSPGVYGTVERRVAHPALGYYPATRPRQITYASRPYAVQWDAPVEHVADNRTTGSSAGLGDGFAALTWLRLYAEGLQDGTALIKALAALAFKHQTAAGQAARTAAAHLSTAQAGVRPDGTLPVGGTATYGPGQELAAVDKSGAFIDLAVFKPLASLVAAAFDVTLTDLLGDPGVTGARATAETLKGPNETILDMRRALWAQSIRRVCAYVIDQAVLAPRGALTGTVTRVGTRLVVELPDEDDRTVDVDFPAYDGEAVLDEVRATVEARDAGLIPPLFASMKALRLLGAEDPDEWLDQMVDAKGRWVDPMAGAGQAAADRARDGLDPEDEA